MSNDEINENFNKEKEGNDLNSILLSKKLDDFYFAILEHRDQLLTDEEFNDILESNITYVGMEEKDINMMLKKAEKNKYLKGFSKSIKKIIYSLAQIRIMRILTLVDGKVYDIANKNFVDFKREMIINYEKATNYYDDSNARVKLVTVEEEPRLSKPEVLMDFDDLTMVMDYEKKYINQKENDDLTKQFIEETYENVKSLKKEK